MLVDQHEEEVNTYCPEEKVKNKYVVRTQQYTTKQLPQSALLIGQAVHHGRQVVINETLAAQS